MCTKKCELQKGHFRRLGGLLRKHPETISPTAEFRVRECSACNFTRPCNAATNFRETHNNISFPWRCTMAMSLTITETKKSTQKDPNTRMTNLGRLPFDLLELGCASSDGFGARWVSRALRSDSNRFDFKSPAGCIWNHARAIWALWAYLRERERERERQRESEPPKRGRKNGAARKLSKNFEELFDSTGRAPKYRTKGCSRYWRPKFAARKSLKCCKNQCLRSTGCQRMSVNTLLCDTLGLADWRFLTFFWRARKLSKSVEKLFDTFGDFVLPALLQKLVGEFFLIFRREIWKIKWEIWRKFSGIFSDPQNKGSKISGKISEHFS